jgi:hypothetical protein
MRDCLTCSSADDRSIAVAEMTEIERFFVGEPHTWVALSRTA